MISIILPYIRDEGKQRCVDAIFEHPIKVGYEILSEKDVHRIGCNPMVNRLVRRSLFDVVCFLHDDSVPLRGFLDEAYRLMCKFDGGWGCVGFNDLFHDKDGPPTHWMIHKRMLRYFPDGVFYSEDYIHTRVDQELKDVCEDAGRYVWAKDAKIRHMNPIYVPGGRDRTHKRCYSDDSVKHDTLVYEKRKSLRRGRCTNITEHGDDG
jgi:hypothetical protein